MLLLGVLLNGCGLSEYEEKMYRSQQRAERLKLEAANLEPGTLTMPTVKKDGQDEPVGSLTLRPPKGISTTPSSDPPRQKFFYRYLPKTQGTNGITCIELAFGSGQENFAADVLRAFESPPAAQVRTLNPPGGRSISFDTWDFDDSKNSYSINIPKNVSSQVAIIFWMEKGKRNTARVPIDLSLESFRP
jgi:hypothetical protein